MVLRSVSVSRAFRPRPACILQPFYPQRIEAYHAHANRFGMTAQFLCNRPRVLAFPTFHHHMSTSDHIGWPLSVACQFPDYAFFSSINS